MRTRAPHFAAAAAWFAPFPPAKVAVERAATVSPARGTACTRTTRSIIIEPTTCTRGCRAPGGCNEAEFTTRAAYHAADTILPSYLRQRRTAAVPVHADPTSAITVGSHQNSGAKPIATTVAATATHATPPVDPI
jgi:hypothetical protein